MIDPTLGHRLQHAWRALTPAQQAAFGPQLDYAHVAARQYLATGVPPPMKGVKHEMLLARTVLNADPEMLTQHSALAIQQLQGNLSEYVDEYGTIWGCGKFEQLDPYWLEALISLWENLVCGSLFEFGSTPPQILQHPVDSFTLALVSDWGTGDWGPSPDACPAQLIGNHIGTLAPDIMVHLGDVYYAGSKGEELANLCAMWPKGIPWNFTLNSNHEMYPGGNPYYNQALSNPLFQRQQQRSCFAIETNFWIIVGLDSAFYSDPYKLYMDGALWPEGTVAPAVQLPLIEEIAAKGKPIVLLTHHNPINEDGSPAPEVALLQQWLSGFSGQQMPPVYWYYGHIHIGAVYSDTVTPGIHYRCIGHGGLPWGYANVLANNDLVRWFECTEIIGSPDQRVANGYAVLRFDGSSIEESFMREDGGTSWQS